MSIDDKDRADLLLKLADFRMTRVTSRRDHEWKVTIAVWALLAAAIAHPPKILWILLLPLLIAIPIIHARFWICPHWLRSKEDIYYSFLYTDEGRATIRDQHKT